MSNILSTPDAVSQHIHAVCPRATVEGQVTESGFLLECNLMAGTQSFEVSHVLNAQEFDKALREFFDQIVVAKAADIRPLSEISFDISRYSLVPPLFGWKNFQRIIARQRGIEYEAILKMYLSSGEDNLVESLRQVGLAPSQLTGELSEQDQLIFTTLFNDLQRTNDPMAPTIFTHLETNYPVVFSFIVAEMKQKFVKAEAETPYLEVLNNLSARVIGQERAAEFLATALASQTKQDGNKNFLFVGPTGVGKTEMAKAVAALKENRFVMLPMNQYMDEHSGSNLFGAPIGYVGSGDEPHFAKSLEQFNPVRKPLEGNTIIYELENVVLLFDELEKAHSKVKQSLLTLLDEGYCLVQYTRRGGEGGGNISKKYVFKKCVFIGTANLYHQMIIMAFRANTELEEIARGFAEWNSTLDLPGSFSPEFLARFSKIVPFGPIPRGESYQKLLQLKINEQLILLKSEFSCQEVRIENTPQVLETLEGLLYGEGYDLRRIKNFFEMNVKGVIYRNITNRVDLSKASLVIVAYEDQVCIKATALVFGKSIDLTELFPLTL